MTLTLTLTLTLALALALSACDARVYMAFWKPSMADCISSPPMSGGKASAICRIGVMNSRSSRETEAAEPMSVEVTISEMRSQRPGCARRGSSSKTKKSPSSCSCGRYCRYAFLAFLGKSSSASGSSTPPVAEWAERGASTAAARPPITARRDDETGTGSCSAPTPTKKVRSTVESEAISDAAAIGKVWGVNART